MRPSLFLILLFLLPAACSRDSGSGRSAELAPTGVVARVNDTLLTRAQLDTQLALRLGPFTNRIAPDRLPGIRARMRRDLVDQFVVRTLLLAEADRRGIHATDADRTNALAKIGARLPPGMTPEDVMKNSPVGEQAMLDELVAGIRINKLLATVVTNLPPPSDALVDAYYKEHQEELRVPETVHARHILFPVPTNAPTGQRAAARARAVQVRRQLLEGADFAAMARRHSACPSKARGGDLGTFDRGKTLPGFEDVAFSLPPNQLSEVVETRYGYHLIEVLDHNPAADPSRETIAAKTRSEQRSERIARFIDQLRRRADISVRAH
jgi:peptidyl-prolyl cis-trans isomerase C